LATAGVTEEVVDAGAFSAQAAVEAQRHANAASAVCLTAMVDRSLTGNQALGKRTRPIETGV
jgi:hypothetical protein